MKYVNGIVSNRIEFDTEKSYTNVKRSQFKRSKYESELNEESMK